jgi:hypothetical protein
MMKRAGQPEEIAPAYVFLAADAPFSTGSFLEQNAIGSGRPRPYGWAEVAMAGAYSADLRGRVLAAMEAGETPDAAARRFAVARSTAYRWATAARDEGRRAAKPVAGGPS